MNYYRVMIVEDEQLIRSNLEKKVNALGNAFHVETTCRNGQDALMYLQKSPVDVVITDIHMPVMNGLDLIRAIVTQYKSIRIVILSGFSEFEYAKAAMQQGVRDYLLKPVDLDELHQTMDRIRQELDRERDPLNVHSGHLSPEQLVTGVRDYIYARLQSRTTVATISHAFGYSPEHLTRIFKKETGLSLLQYITDLRMNEAKRMLLDPAGYDIGYVGQAVGYADALYFSRAFQKNTGFSPSDFRKIQSS